LISKIKNPSLDKFNLKPWFLGFKGEVVKKDTADADSAKDSYTTKGIYERIDVNKVLVSELSVGNWTQDYKDYL
jgi:hypothetical protein